MEKDVFGRRQALPVTGIAEKGHMSADVSLLPGYEPSHSK